MVQSWSDAVTLSDLGELTAQWIEGTLKFHPCYCADTVDEETYPLRKVLAKYNRNGFVTTFSQPGELDKDKSGGQRACVDGYAPEELAKRIYTLSLHTDLIVLLLPPGEGGGYQLPITVEDYCPFTWCGACRGDEELQHFDKELSLAGQMALRAAWYVCVIDPKWGRKSYLWKKLLEAVSGEVGPFSASPAPDLSLDRDFVY